MSPTPSFHLGSMRYWRARADSQSLGCPPLADRHRGLGADLEKILADQVPDILDGQQAGA